MASGKSSFGRGVSSFRSGAYAEALEYFNESINLGASQSNVYDSRAATYEKLEKFKEAINDSRKVIELAPNQWQGYARCARLFLRLKKPENALKMVEFATERVKEDDAKRQGELIALKQQILHLSETIQRHRSRTAYHFGNLPVEVAHEIFSLVIANESASVVILSHVCQNWRSVTTNTPSFWFTLILTNRHPIRKIKVWKERSRGKVVELHLLEGVCEHYYTLRQGLEGFSWSCLRVLRTTINPAYIFGLDSSVTAQTFAALDELELCGDRISYGMLFYPNMRSRILSIRDVPVFLEDIGMSFSKLESLSCSAGFLTRASSFIQMLRGNPSMQTLCLSSSPPIPATFVADIHTEVVTEMANLHHLQLDNLSRLFTIITDHVSMPSLEVLRLSCMQGALDGGMNHLLSHHPSLALTELTIRSCSILAGSLLGVLRASPCIQTLVLIGLSGVNSFAEFLAESGVHSETPTTSSLPCPLLKAIDFSSSSDLNSGPIIRLVKARLTDGAHAKLESLTLDGCPLIEADMLPWIRSKVPKFSCVYLTKKQAVWKR